MEEIEKMTMELLKEMEDMDPATIECFRQDWFNRSDDDKLRSERVDNYVNALCDVAIARALERSAVA